MQSIIQIFATLTSACFLFSFHVLTSKLVLERIYYIRRRITDELYNRGKSASLLSYRGSTNLIDETANLERTRYLQLELALVNRQLEKTLIILWAFFTLELIISLSITLLTAIAAANMDYTTGKLNYGEELDITLITLGILKLILFDAPMFAIFIRENLLVKRLGKQQYKQAAQAGEKRIALILNFVIILSSVIYIERIIVNDIVYRLFFYIQSQGSHELRHAFTVFSDTHVIIVTSTDFIGGVLQLYLSFWFGQMHRRGTASSRGDDDDAFNPLLINNAVQGGLTESNVERDQDEVEAAAATEIKRNMQQYQNKFKRSVNKLSIR